MQLSAVVIRQCKLVKKIAIRILQGNIFLFLWCRSCLWKIEFVYMFFLFLSCKTKSYANMYIKICKLYTCLYEEHIPPRKLTTQCYFYFWSMHCQFIFLLFLQRLYLEIRLTIAGKLWSLYCAQRQRLAPIFRIAARKISRPEPKVDAHSAEVSGMANWLTRDV